MRRSFHQVVLFLIGALLVTGCTTAGSPTSQSSKATAPRTPVTTILIGLDGFHPEYLQRGATPVLNSLAADGVLSSGMRPAFPTLTFPNHYTLVTGLSPDRHGIIDNTMRDPAIPGALFRLGDQKVMSDPRWWMQATPLWVTAEKQGVRTATMFWPGSDVPHNGVLPSQWLTYDAKMTSEARVDTVLGWFDLPVEQRPRFMTLYLEAVDKAGHAHGASSADILPSLREVDGAVARLLAGLKARGLTDKVNLVIVADHGMVDLPADNVFALDEIVPRDIAMPIGHGAVVGMIPAAGRLAEAEAALLRPHPHMQCWRKSEIPQRLKFGSNDRVAPIFCMAEIGWFISPSLKGPKRPLLPGYHGYDNQEPSMAALFIGKGPDFQRGKRIGSFDNVDIYPLLTWLVGIKPEANEGRLETLAPFLVTPPALSS